LLSATVYDPKELTKAVSSDTSIIGSPMKKQRASVSGAAVDPASGVKNSADALAKGLGFGFVGGGGGGGGGLGAVGGDAQKREPGLAASGDVLSKAKAKPATVEEERTPDNDKGEGKAS
jgi:hypothetical protein